jgi:hypothetical protein
MPEFECPSIIQQQIWQQVQQLHCSQTAPYELMVADYTGCLQRKRDLEVAIHHTSAWLRCLAQQQGCWQGITEAPNSTAGASPADV